MTSRISKGSITGRKAYSDGGLALSIGTRATRGIRHAIARRAPDSVKISGVPKVSEYKFTKSFTYGPYNALYGVATSPYISSFGVTLLTGTALSPLFANNVSSIKFEITDGAKNFTLQFDSGTGAGLVGIEQFITKTAGTTNKYNFKIPTGVTLAALNNFLYSNGGAFVTTATPATQIKLTAAVGFGYADVAALNAALALYVNDKTFEFEMRENDGFSLKSANLNIASW